MVRVGAEAVDGPDHGCGSCFVAGGEESHHLVDEVLLRETAGGESDGNDVDTGLFVFGVGFALLVFDKLTTDFADRLGGGWDLLIAGNRDAADDPGRKDKTEHSKHLGLFAGGEDLAVCGT